MPRKRRPLWAPVFSICAIGAAAVGAGFVALPHLFGREC